MGKTSSTILRVGLAITFLWIGISIYKSPEAWGSFMQPWAANLLPIPVKQAMIGTSFLDMLIGFMLIIDTWTWIFALLGSIHILIVLTVSGINEITVRDIGLFTGILALTIESFPEKIYVKLFSWEKNNTNT